MACSKPQASSHHSSSLLCRTRVVRVPAQFGTPTAYTLLAIPCDCCSLCFLRSITRAMPYLSGGESMTMRSTSRQSPPPRIRNTFLIARSRCSREWSRARRECNKKCRSRLDDNGRQSRPSKQRSVAERFKAKVLIHSVSSVVDVLAGGFQVGGHKQVANGSFKNGSYERRISTYTMLTSQLSRA
ncbi:hypothetical protein VTK26DRAFT_8505 [Humicola hyalothermophila]